MSRETIEENDPDLAHFAGGIIVTGDDRPQLKRYDSPDDMPMMVKSVRVTIGLFEAVEKIGHPDGFSGVVREALAEYLEKHTGTQTQISEAEAAIAVIIRTIRSLSEDNKKTA